MFTGIAEEIGRVASLPDGSLVIAAGKAMEGMEPGGSISVNGACLTVKRFDKSSFKVDIMPETLERTNIGRLRSGDRVNLERPLTLNKPLGGHLVQGHVDATGNIISIIKQGETTLIKIEAPPEVMYYIVEKGFIAVDGISLTITGVESGSFGVSIVDYTLQNTVLRGRRVGDIVNLEADIIAKYVEKFNKGEKSGITLDLLRESGFTEG